MMIFPNALIGYSFFILYFALSLGRARTMRSPLERIRIPKVLISKSMWAVLKLGRAYNTGQNSCKARRSLIERIRVCSGHFDSRRPSQTFRRKHHRAQATWIIALEVKNYETCHSCFLGTKWTRQVRPGGGISCRQDYTGPCPAQSARFEKHILSVSKML